MTRKTRISAVSLPGIVTSGSVVELLRRVATQVRRAAGNPAVAFGTPPSERAPGLRAVVRPAALSRARGGAAPADTPILVEFRQLPEAGDQVLARAVQARTPATYKRLRRFMAACG